MASYYLGGLEMFTVVTALMILIATAVLGGVCIMLLRDPPSTETASTSDRGEPVTRVVKGGCGKTREYYAADVAPSGTAPLGMDANRPPMFPGLMTLQRLLDTVVDRLRPMAARAGLPVAAERRSLRGELVSLAGTVVEPWQDAVYRLGIEYPLQDRELVRRAVESVQAAWGRMAGDEPRMTPMAQRIAITGLLSDDTCRRALAGPRSMTDAWLVDKAQTLLARQVLTPSPGHRRAAGSGS